MVTSGCLPRRFTRGLQQPVGLLALLVALSVLVLMYGVYQWSRLDYVLIMKVNARETPTPARVDDNVHQIINRTFQMSPPSSPSPRRTEESSFSAEDLFQFEPFVSNPGVENFTRDIADQYPCTQPGGVVKGIIEDLMCIPRPNFLPEFKNPCFQDENEKLKCLPYFLLLGYDKCGTTDFHARLLSHSQILKNDAYMGKEVFFWGWRRYGVWMNRTDEYISNFDEYVNIFKSATEIINESKEHLFQPVVGDGGPVDIWDFRGWPQDPQNEGLAEPKVLSPHHIRHLFKDPKFIVLMRNPVERLYSDYLFLQYGDTAEEFDRDVPVALEMMTSCLKVSSIRQCFYSGDMYVNMPMRLHISCYSVFLREWLTVFHRKHFFILRTEDYHTDMRRSLEAVFDFLEVEVLSDSAMDEVMTQDKKFENKAKARAGHMSKETRKLLEDFYAPCNRDLSDLLQDDRFLWLDN